MRWDEQRVENDLRLPGIGDGTVLRTFDVPEAMGINFHEVKARSALNHVPGARFGFNWTINPYRGCSHACVYCLAGDTRILMADGTTKPLCEIGVGDAIYGTAEQGAERRYERTRVLAHWRTVRPAYRLTLEDGTELIASGDHRFLGERGWRYVHGAPAESPPRPRLAEREQLLGPGRAAAAPRPSREYRRGYLSGMIRRDEDLAGATRRGPGRDGGRLRLALADPESLGRARDYLAEAGVRTCRLGSGTRGGGQAVAIRTASRRGAATVRELMRRPRSPSGDWVRGYLDATNGGHRALAGTAVGGAPGLRVASVEPLGIAMEMYDITTGTGDFIANGVVSHNCFARRTHTYLDLNAGRDFEREIVVKVNLPELLRRELARPTWRRELVALGTNTDPYQWVESRYRMMPEILAALEAAGTPVSVLTKSPLAMRDVELFERMAKRLPVSVNLSVPTLDEDAWRATEPHTPSPAARLDAVAELRRRGIDSGVLIAPLMPGINDDPEQVRPIVERAKKAGASFLGGVALHLRGEVKDVFFGWLAAKRPDLLPDYEKLYRDRAYMRPEQRKRATRAVRGWGKSRLRRAKPRSSSPSLQGESSQGALF
ncbi:MAG TPA: radical SAM protein [Solirubrobacterales bacterium]|jgi:DNA repair photolyase|nr:radical SAM protein [Solirubrobacterales bacterium]